MINDETIITYTETDPGQETSPEEMEMEDVVDETEFPELPVEDVPPRRKAESPIIKWLHFLAQPIPFLAILLVIIATIGFGIWKFADNTSSSPKGVVAQFYLALEEKNESQAVELIPPNEQENGIGFSVKILFEPNTSLSYEKLEITELEKSQNDAVVNVSGIAKLRLEGQTRQVSFSNDLQLLKFEGKWYLRNPNLEYLFEIEL